jgi:hypothetical protein
MRPQPGANDDRDCHSTSDSHVVFGAEFHRRVAATRRRMHCIVAVRTPRERIARVTRNAHDQRVCNGARDAR